MLRLNKFAVSPYVPEAIERSFMNQPEEPRQVIVVDLQLPFISMVLMMVKWALASIPALMILFAIFSFVTTVMGGMMTSVVRL